MCLLFSDAVVMVYYVVHSSHTFKVVYWETILDSLLTFFSPVHIYKTVYIATKYICVFEVYMKVCLPHMYLYNAHTLCTDVLESQDMVLPTYYATVTPCTIQSEVYT